MEIKELLPLVWAKSSPFKSLRAHMIDTGLCAVEFLKAESSVCFRNFLQDIWQCTEEKAVGMAAYLCSIHDIGKNSPDFQRRDDDCLKNYKDKGYGRLFECKKEKDFRHEKYSAWIMEKLWVEKDSMDEDLAKCYAEVLALHHQKERKGKKKRYPAEWGQLQMELERQMRELFCPCESLPMPKHRDAVCLFLTGLVILCDWTASSEPWEGLEETKDYIETSRSIAGKTLRSYGLISDRIFPYVRDFKAMWPEIKNPRPLQRACMELSDDALLTIIEAPMGEGKTETALYLAGKICNKRKKRGIYMALPSQATSNQMVLRVSAMLETMGMGKARLLHGAAFLKEDEEIQKMGEEMSEWLRPLRRAMLGGNAVGTVDQAMAAVLNNKFSVLRLLGLQNKVLIIDEIHAYDRYMSWIINRLLAWCRVLSIPVILLSATLQAEQRKQYIHCYGAEFSGNEDIPYPAVTQVDEKGRISLAAPKAAFSSSYTWKAVRKLGDAKGIAELAVDLVKEGGCLCVLMNTVRNAQELYKEVKKIKGQDTECLLFHARFPVGRREQIEKECLDRFGKQSETRPEKAIVIATQVIEQSLDLDFDGMITEIAPIDLLLQRSGRVHRHQGRIRPKTMKNPIIIILVPDSNDNNSDFRYGLTGCVYDPFLLQNTEMAIKEECHIRVPEDVRPIIDYVYNNINEEMIESYMKRQAKQIYMENEADSKLFGKPDIDTFFPAESGLLFDDRQIDDGLETGQRASTRMGEPTMRIAFCSRQLFEKIQKGALSSEDEREIFGKSAVLKLTGEEDTNAIKIKKGKLKGVMALCGENECVWGNYHIVNDPEIGIVWKE